MNVFVATNKGIFLNSLK